MKFHVMTLFPEMIEAYVGKSILKRAREKGLIEVTCYNIRDFSENKHKKTDDYPFGGGAGMVMSVQPVYSCFKHILNHIPEGENHRTLYLSPGGETHTQKKAMELVNFEHLILLCGHYEGVDQRAIELIGAEEISIGDYVLTGGELGAMVLIDSISRMVEGVLSSSESYEQESFYHSLLEYPQYTRPREYEGLEVPEVLLSGDHKKIEEWRRQKSLYKTWKNRPDLLEHAELTQKEREKLHSWTIEE